VSRDFLAGSVSDLSSAVPAYTVVDALSDSANSEVREREGSAACPQSGVNNRRGAISRVAYGWP
jgi:hypothetical protein